MLRYHVLFDEYTPLGLIPLFASVTVSSGQ